MSAMQLSIVIVSWNVAEELRECLHSIDRHAPRGGCEVIVVDNASSDATVDIVARCFPHVKLLANTDNRGFSAANNQGIRLAQGRYVLLLNPDCAVHEGTLDAMIGLLDQDPAIGACGPRLIAMDGRLYESVGYLPTFRAMLLGKTALRSVVFLRPWYRKLTSVHVDYDRQTDVEQLSGAAIMVRESVLKEIGGLDEAFFLYYEDVDLCLRIRQAEWRLVYTPEAVITHLGGRSTQGVSLQKQVMLHRGLFVFFRKHRGRLATGLFGLLFKPGVLIMNLIDVLSGTLAYLFFILTFDGRHRTKAAAKVRNSAGFLAYHSWEFLRRV